MLVRRIVQRGLMAENFCCSFTLVISSLVPPDSTTSLKSGTCRAMFLEAISSLIASLRISPFSSAESFVGTPHELVRRVGSVRYQ